MGTLDKPQEFINAYNRFRKGSMLETAKKCMADPLSDNSKILTVIHGDYWLNNMMFNEDETKAKTNQEFLIWIDFMIVQFR